MSVGVVVGTYGRKDYWESLARRAMSSAEEAGAIDLAWVHGNTLARARNYGGATRRSDWLVFLDADDRLAPGYVQAVENAAADHPDATLLQPSEDRGEGVFLREQRDLGVGNYLVIGTAVRRDLFGKHGGFREWPIYEDWCLFLRMHLAGDAVVAPAPDAVYVAIEEGGRNLQRNERWRKMMQHRIRTTAQRERRRA